MRQGFITVCVCAVHVLGASLSSYHFGNSLTDQFDGLASIASSKGDALTWARTTIPGAGICYLWDNAGLPSAYRGRAFDIVLELAFCNGNQLGVNYDALCMKNYYDEALRSNANCRLCVFGQWPSNDGRTWESQWNATLDTTRPGYAQPYGSAQYHETLVRRLRIMYPTKTVSLVPVGHVMDEFHRRAKAGQIAGFSSAFDLYADGIHLNTRGKYLQNLTGYAVYFRKSPQGAGLSFSQWSGTETVTQAFADLAYELVWTVVTRMSELTNVPGTGIGPQPAVAVTPLPRVAAETYRYGIDGRLLPPHLRAPGVCIVQVVGAATRTRVFLEPERKAVDPR